MYQELDICDYMENRTDDGILVDIRDKHAYDCGTIPGAIHIPIDEIGRLYELPKNKKIYLFCQAGEISRQFAELLDDSGYEAYSLSGGYRQYFKEHIAK
jgi:rhodanese-related sulfurtransferase